MQFGLLRDVDGERFFHGESAMFMLFLDFVLVLLLFNFRHADEIGDELFELIEVQTAAAVAVNGVEVSAKLLAVNVALTSFL